MIVLFIIPDWCWWILAIVTFFFLIYVIILMRIAATSDIDGPNFLSKKPKQFPCKNGKPKESQVSEFLDVFN